MTTTAARRIVLAVAGTVSLAGCQNDTSRVLLRPPEGTAQFSNYAPTAPFEGTASGALARTVFAERSASSGLRIEVQELLVAPKRSTAGHTFPAAALLDVRAGAASIRRGGDKAAAPVTLRSGATLTVPDGEPVVIENTSADEPLVVTVYLFSAR